MALDHLAQPRKIFGPTTVNPVSNDWLNLYGPITEDNRSTRGSLVCFLTFLLHFFNYITLFQLISSPETHVTLYHIHTLTSLTRSHFTRLNFHNKRSFSPHKIQNPKRNLCSRSPKISSGLQHPSLQSAINWLLIAYHCPRIIGLLLDISFYW